MASERDYSKYPCGQDVLDVLTNLGLTLAPGLDTQGAASAAAAEWERKTRWYPFLAGPPQTRLMTPPRFGPQAGRMMSAQGGRILEIEGGLLDLPDDGLLIGYVPNTSDQIGIAEGITDSTGSQGTVLTRGIQYYLRPDNADKRGYPWTYIEFPTPTRGLVQSIVLRNATFGRVKILPADVWLAVARYAVSTLAPEISLNISKGLYQWRDGDEQERYGGAGDVGPLSSQAGDWEDKFAKLAKFYRRPVA